MRDFVGFITPDGTYYNLHKLGCTEHNDALLKLFNISKEEAYMANVVFIHYIPVLYNQHSTERTLLSNSHVFYTVHNRLTQKQYDTLFDLHFRIANEDLPD